VRPKHLVRALTVVDEQMKDVIVHDTTVAAAASVPQWCQEKQRHRPW
jgi:hypothetical protein